MKHSKFIKWIRRQLLKDKSFSIISNNCWGGFIDQYFGLKYTSPFIGLFLFSQDYLKLLKNLKYYMSIELKFIDAEKSKYKNKFVRFGKPRKYPIGVLEDIEIHFIHYQNEKAAYKKWEYRKYRLNYNDLIVKFCDWDLATAEEIKEFSALKYTKKVVMTAKKYPYKCCMKLKNEDGDYVKNEWSNFKKTVKVIKFMNKKKWEMY